MISENLRKVVSLIILHHREVFQESLSVMKLQHLCYYAQGIYMATQDGEPLFEEDCESSSEGPKIPALYDKYKEYCWKHIPDEFEFPELEPEKIDLIEQIVEDYGRYDGAALATRTVLEDPCLNARQSLSETAGSNALITKESMKTFFKNNRVSYLSYKALDIAKYFITLANPEAEDFITNLKLQKLLYYAQGFHLALFGKPLFRESLEAWQSGPVVPEIYRIYKQYGSSPLPQPDDFNLKQYDRQTQELLDEVYEVYGQYTAPTLRHFIDRETPWKETPVNQEISHQLMTAYFTTHIPHFKM